MQRVRKGGGEVAAGEVVGTAQLQVLCINARLDLITGTQLLPG